MALVSVTRIRIPRWADRLRFHWATFRSARQAQRSEGYHDGAILTDAGHVYWTLTMWHDIRAMHRYRNNDAHRHAMRHAFTWADQMASAHWEQPESILPSWAEASKRLRESGHTARVGDADPMPVERAPPIRAGAKSVRLRARR